ncbi:tetratricopeptide repeat protein [Pontibacter sp. HSC-36F09]|uniref:tetratricopeptide repeat protein n=1 Tax=Pontibacter sp. HSC-36F09 TaxID=2910966 RepID=UPI00209F746A|nr:tetratricopeptide repeat protein [Pontibacter sp. HSC-36F09]MCP2044037.1 tetratricopeptide (TPR) repeat protein [Pontibacter sp. HSC-36F09]
MSQNRLEQLFKFYEEDPNDPFTIYAIATELRGSDPQKAMEFYEKLLSEHERYVGTYYHAASLYAEFGQSEKAEQTYKKGMLISRQEGNMHAFAELQQAYNKFAGLDYEDE